VQGTDRAFYGMFFGGETGAFIARITSTGAVTQLHTLQLGGPKLSPLYNYSGPSSLGLLESADGHLYGTTPDGGRFSNGTLFRLNLQTLVAPAVTVASAGANGGRLAWSVIVAAPTSRSFGPPTAPGISGTPPGLPPESNRGTRWTCSSRATMTATARSIPPSSARPTAPGISSTRGSAPPPTSNGAAAPTCRSR